MLLVQNTISGAQNEHVGERASEPALLIAILILITTQAKRNLSSRSGIGGVLSAT